MKVNQILESKDVEESGLQYYTGVKKHGKEYMKKAAAAGRKGASQAEIGALKDKYSKAHKNEVKESDLDEVKKGLYYYVNKRKKAGTSRSKNHPDAPSAQDWKNAAKTAKNESMSEGQTEGEATLAKIAASGDDGYEMIYDGLNGLLGTEAQIMLQDMYDDISIDNRLHPDDDFEEIQSRMMDRIEDQYGGGVAEDKVKGVDGKACWKGKRYAGKVKKADGTYKDKCVPMENTINEEESDYYRDYKAGLISYAEYQELVKQFQDRNKQMRYAEIDRDRGPWYIKVNGKILKSKGLPKVFDWKRGAIAYGNAILKNKPELQGKIYLTKKSDDDQPSVSESKTTVKVPVKQKPRQGPLRPQTGAGAHKDKKKDQKQGKEKHKKPMYEDGTLKVSKDDQNMTILQNPTTGVQTQIDKKNPNAPRLTQDEQGKLKLTMPQGAQTGQTGQEKPDNLVGKDVSVSTNPVEDVHRISASPSQPGGEITDVNPRSPISGDEDHDEISKLLNQRLRKLAGVSESLSETGTDKDLGNGFTLTTTEFNGKAVPAVFDSQGNRYWIKNDSGDRQYGMSQFITIQNGKATGSNPGPMTAAALKQAGMQTAAPAAPASLSWNQMTPDQQAAFRAKQQADDAAAAQGGQNIQNYFANKNRTPSAPANETLDQMLRIAGLR